MAKRATALLISILLCFNSTIPAVFAEEAPEDGEPEEVTELMEEIEEPEDTLTESSDAVSEEEANIEITEESEEAGDLEQAAKGRISGKLCYMSGDAAAFNEDVTLYLYDSEAQRTEYSCVVPKGTSEYTFTGIPDGEYFVGTQFDTEFHMCNIGMNSQGTKAVIKSGSAVADYNAYVTWNYDTHIRYEEEDLVINKNGTNAVYVMTYGNTMELQDAIVYDMKFNKLATVKVTGIDIYEDGKQYVYLDPAPVRALAQGDYQFMLEFKSGVSFKDFKIIGEKTDYDMQFVTEGEKSYWFEGGVKQGTYDDPNGVIGDGTVRGREIFDEATHAWYWLDAVYDGARAINKEVWMPYIFQDEKTWKDDAKRMNDAVEGSNTYSEAADGTIANMGEQVKEAILNESGKWVRYDENGAMFKGWLTIEGEVLEKLYPTQKGHTYYYDYKTGLMAKGWTTIGGKQYHFDEITGVLIG